MIRAFDSTVLAALLLLPLVGAAAVWLCGAAERGPGRGPLRGLARYNAGMFALAELLLAAIATVRLANGGDVYFTAGWVRSGLGLGLTLELDALSAPLLIVATGLFAAAVLTDRPIGRRGRANARAVGLLALEACVVAVLLSRDALLTVLAMQLAGIALGGLVGAFGAGDRDRSARRLWVRHAAADGALLLGVLAWGWMHFDRTGVLSFDRLDLVHLDIAPPAGAALLALLTAGLVLKSGIAPLHGWFRRAMDRGGPPTRLASLTVLHLGPYAFARLVLPGLEAPLAPAAPLLAACATGALFVTACAAVVQRRLSGWAAYLAVFHVTLAWLAMLTRSEAGVTAAWSLLIASGLLVGGLVLAASRLGDEGGHGLATPAPRPSPAVRVLLVLLLLEAVLLPGLAGIGPLAGLGVRPLSAGRRLWLHFRAMLAAAGLGGPLWFAFGGVAMACVILLTVRAVLHAVRPRADDRRASDRDRYGAGAAWAVCTALLGGAALAVAAWPAGLRDAVRRGAGELLAARVRPEVFTSKLAEPLATTGLLRLSAAWVVVCLAGLFAGAAMLLRPRPGATALGAAGVWLAILSFVAAGAPQAPGAAYVFHPQTAGVFLAAVCMLGVVGMRLALASARHAGAPVRDLHDLRGLSGVCPGAAATIAICLASLSGVGLTGGFFARCGLLGAMLMRGWAVPALLTLFVYAAMAATAAKMIALMSFAPPLRSVPLGARPGGMSGQLYRAALAGIAAAIILLGLTPQAVLAPLVAWLSR